MFDGVTTGAKRLKIAKEMSIFKFSEEAYWQQMMHVSCFTLFTSFTYTVRSGHRFFLRRWPCSSIAFADAAFPARMGFTSFMFRGPQSRAFSRAKCACVRPTKLPRCQGERRLALRTCSRFATTRLEKWKAGFPEIRALDRTIVLCPFMTMLASFYRDWRCTYWTILRGIARPEAIRQITFPRAKSLTLWTPWMIRCATFNAVSCYRGSPRSHADDLAEMVPQCEGA